MPLPYGILTNPAYGDGAEDSSVPLPTVAPQQDALPMIRAAVPAIQPQAPIFRPNPLRQRQEQALESTLMTPKAKPTGFWPKAASILGDIGNVAGTVILGNDKMAGIPGTSQYKANQTNAEEKQLVGLENQDTAAQKEFNTEQDSAAKRALEGSQAGEADARAQAANQPDLAKAYAHRVNEVLAQGGDPSQDPITQHLADAITSIQKQPAAKGAHFIQREVDNKPHTVAVDDATGADIRDEGPTGERPPTVNVNAGQNEADKIAARLAKPYETAATQAQAKLDRIDQTVRSVDAGYVGQGLAIPELLTSLVSGQGTGVRITQPELNAITAHRGIKGNAESWFNSLAGSGHLTDTDKAQIKNVLNDAKVRVQEKIQLMNDAQDAINGAADRRQVTDADKKYRAIQLGMEKYMEVRRDDQGNWYGSNDGGKTTYDLATGKAAQ